MKRLLTLCLLFTACVTKTDPQKEFDNTELRFKAIQREIQVHKDMRDLYMQSGRNDARLHQRSIDSLMRVSDSLLNVMAEQALRISK